MRVDGRQPPLAEEPRCCRARCCSTSPAAASRSTSTATSTRSRRATRSSSTAASRTACAAPAASPPAPCASRPRPARLTLSLSHAGGGWLRAGGRPRPRVDLEVLPCPLEEAARGRAAGVGDPDLAGAEPRQQPQQPVGVARARRAGRRRAPGPTARGQQRVGLVPRAAQRRRADAVAAAFSRASSTAAGRPVGGQHARAGQHRRHARQREPAAELQRARAVQRRGRRRAWRAPRRSATARPSRGGTPRARRPPRRAAPRCRAGRSTARSRPSSTIVSSTRSSVTLRKAGRLAPIARGDPRVTSVDVARAAGVSQSTVSLVLSGKGQGRISATHGGRRAARGRGARLPAQRGGARAAHRRRALGRLRRARRDAPVLRQDDARRPGGGVVGRLLDRAGRRAVGPLARRAAGGAARRPRPTGSCTSPSSRPRRGPAGSRSW